MKIFRLMKKMLIRKRREEIAQNATQTLKAFKTGKAKRGKFSDLKTDLLD